MRRIYSAINHRKTESLRLMFATKLIKINVVIKLYTTRTSSRREIFKETRYSLNAQNFLLANKSWFTVVRMWPLDISLAPQEVRVWCRFNCKNNESLSQRLQEKQKRFCELFIGDNGHGWYIHKSLKLQCSIHDLTSWKEPSYCKRGSIHKKIWKICS